MKPYILTLLSIYSIISFLSCRQVEVEFDCDEVDTQITEIDHEVGTFVFPSFMNSISFNYEQAAISIVIEGFEITSDTETSCFAFTPLPQVLESIRIASPEIIESKGMTFDANSDISELFKIQHEEDSYSINDFIIAHQNAPTIFHMEGDELIFQLQEAPDAFINQAFTIEFIFTDSNSIVAEIPLFQAN